MIPTHIPKLSRVAHSFTGIVELSIREESKFLVDRVANGAVAPLRIEEDCETAYLGLGERCFIAGVLIAIKRRVAAEEGTFETREGILDPPHSDVGRAESILEHGMVSAVGLELGNNRDTVLLAHFDGIDNGTAGLLLETDGAA